MSSLVVDALDHLVINVNDVATSAEWYQRVLGMTRQDFQPAPGRETRTALRFGVQKVNLRPAAASRVAWFTAHSVSPGSQDLCFLTTSTPAEVVEHLRRCAVAVEAGPTEKPGARGKLRSVYCRDPDGNLIEIASYPP
jgi:catechol 2,3-dioxygenase-like lactoylglutathione lyase family enzyme